MKFFDKAINASIYALLFWYLVSLIYAVPSDNTMDFGLKMSFQIINCLMVIMMLRVIVFSYKFPNFTDFSVAFCMIFWFLYSTYRDYIEQGYSAFLKSFYVGIDLISVMFLIYTFLNFLLESSLFILTAEKTKQINNILRICLGMSFSFIYFHFCRSIKWY